MPSSQSGYITLLALLIVGVIGIAITSSILLSGVGSTQYTLTGQQGALARTYVQACAEEGLQQLRDNTAFTGIGSLSFSEGACSYDVDNTGGDTRRIRASSTVDAIIRRVEVSVDALSPQITISSWEDVVSF